MFLCKFLELACQFFYFENSFRNSFLSISRFFVDRKFEKSCMYIYFMYIICFIILLLYYYILRFIICIYYCMLYVYIYIYIYIYIGVVL